MSEITFTSVHCSDLAIGDTFSWGSHAEWYVRVANSGDDGMFKQYRSLRTGQVTGWGQGTWPEHVDLLPSPGDAMGRLMELESAVERHVQNAESYETQIANLRQNVSTMQSEFESWKQRATGIAHDYANNNSLCREFDRAMVAIGLPPRFTSVKIRLEFPLEVSDPNDYAAVRSAILNATSDPVAYARSNGYVYVEDEEGDEIASW